ncbi:MAG: hypothetical protein JXN59_10240 [Anaerolineae bacterium]|nr:hypothetical protein [Anaerolineae bacterium]
MSVREQVTVSPVGAYTNIRSEPGGPDIGDLRGEHIAFRLPDAQQAGGYTWHYYEFVDGTPNGWIAVEVVVVEPYEPPVSTPDPMTPERWLLILRAQRDLYDQYASSAAHMRNMLQEEIDRLEALSDGA